MCGVTGTSSVQSGCLSCRSRAVHECSLHSRYLMGSDSRSTGFILLQTSRNNNSRETVLVNTGAGVRSDHIQSFQR